ncbi:ABC transporter permease [Jeotgalibaca ciconiae]|uniref:ABC transporter permease n=1 Tax=Jeotgalibaca ciconiae TaxID=2496265 RepID=A0A3Q9BKM4_9LACT|nr:ABC transporter permease [Jeotgalibaca ciconiae]AZP03444.1 ABC transporter permease [Jeotgalibaca ciconiae]HJB24936.1 ABC transporter permease [Candidatus Jeotgalibaca pullicola]
MSNQKAKKWLPYILTAPSLVIVLVFVVYPISSSVLRSFRNRETGSFTFEHYQYFLTDPLQRANILYTLEIVLWTILFTIVASYFLAIYLRFSKSRISKWMGMLTLLPRFIPGMVAVYSVILVIRDSGVLNRVGLLFGQEWKLGWMFNEKGIILMNLWFSIPFATLIIFAALSGIQDSIIESAKDVGASKWQIFRSMILPLSYKDGIVATTFIFLGNVGSFTTPFLMGGNSPKMLGIALYDQFNSYMDYERAAALSVIMFLICSFSAVVYIYTNLKEQEWEKGR